MSKANLRNGDTNFWDLDVADFRPRAGAIAPLYDVAIVGAGYSGLATAMFLARRGMSVVVVDAERIGFGCSSRNGGMVGPSFHKLGMAGLTQKYGADLAHRLLRAGMDALDFFEDVVASEKIDCDFRLTGRFRGARSTVAFEAMRRECERLGSQVGLPFELVGPDEVRSQVGSSIYKGGVIYPRDGGVHPKKLVNGLASRAEAHGALLLEGWAVQKIEKTATAFRVRTSAGTLSARQVVIATDGYSGRELTSMYRRTMPIWVTVAATRDLGEEAVRDMSPNLRMHGETGRVFIWSRPSPDGRRFIFGGRFSHPSMTIDEKRARVAAKAGRIFESLTFGDIEHVWHGKVAYTMDHAPHINCIDGMWHIGGYCGSGLTRSVFFAHKLACKLTGQGGGDSAFDELVFPKVPLRFLSPMVTGVLTRYYGMRDAMDDRRAR